MWVVDDSALDAERARSSLSADYEITVFGDGSSALEALHAGAAPAPDVIILDWVMPGLTGVEVVPLVRNSGRAFADVQLLLLTVRTTPEQIVEGLGAGANDYLSKPYAPEELRARVQALLRAAATLARARAAEAEQADLLDSAPDAMLVVDASGRLRFANAEALRALVSPGAIGQPLAGELAELGQRLRSAGRDPEDLSLDGRIYAASVRTQARRGDGRTIVTLRDVTERRRQDQRRLDLYAIIAHDLRAPLQAMMMRTSMLRQGLRGALEPAVQDELAKLDDSQTSMIELINDFLELARSEADTRAAPRESVDLAALARASIDGLSPLASARAQRITWAAAGPMVVFGEKRGLSQVLSNLLGNALKFSAHGGVVELGISREGKVVRTTVRDSGPGIPADEQTRLFDRFTRGSSQEHREGTGLGLMIVREVVESHGGRVGVQSVLGQGSAFWFELPALEP